MFDSRFALKLMLAIYNELANILNDIKPVKRFASAAVCAKKLNSLVADLPQKHFVHVSPQERQFDIRPDSSFHVVATATLNNVGATRDELANLLAEYYKSKGKSLENPRGRVQDVFRALVNTKGYGFIRVGDRYWLVQA